MALPKLAERAESPSTGLPPKALPSLLGEWGEVRPQQPTLELERLYRKQRLAAAFRLFGRLGYDFGGAGHITVRDPEHSDRFWLNPASVAFKHIRVSDLLLVSHDGKILEHGNVKRLNRAAFAIHSRLHAARPDVQAAAHAHSIYGKAFSALGKLLDPLTQDSCAFYGGHSVVGDFSGVVLEADEGDRIASVLGDGRAVILQNHGLLTVGPSLEIAVWRYLAMENACQAQFLVESVGGGKLVPHEVALHTAEQTSGPASENGFLPYFDIIARDQPDLFD